MRKMWVVIRREFVERVRSKWFIIGTVLGPVLMFGLIALPILMAEGGSANRTIAVLDATTGEFGSRITEALDRLAQVHLDDIKDGVHEHRMFGTGDLDLPGVLHALIEVGYDGMAAVELSRDAHRGPEAAAEAMEHLRSALV